MAEIAVASCHDKRNFGSMLQAWATERAASLLGHDAVTIDKTGLGAVIGRGRRSYYAEHLFDLGLYRAKLGFVGHRLRQKLNGEFGSEMARRYRAFDRFAAERFRLSPRFGSLAELGEWTQGLGAVVVGSDQLWLPVNIAGGYYTLDFVEAPCRKVSYATSFGVSELPGKYMREAARFLPSFSAVSVREDTGADLAERATGSRPAVVCDPTMLLSREEWDSVADSSLVPDAPYALCYFMGRNLWQRECARREADRCGLRLVAIAHPDEYVKYDDSYADVYPWGAGPAEWVALISHADMVFTDSFHGTAFSNIFERPFVSFRRHENMGAQSTNSRLDSLLGRLELEGRICESADAFEAIAASDVDFASSRPKLEDFRAESFAWLGTALSGEERA
ncbi:polysaccharide pyruvyl transferase family protein [Collinsella tanakaei]|nr:polysaccharide pyruvyl transferase family protein [Collinsella tanakaei]